jgi:hypothetical protein
MCIAWHQSVDFGISPCDHGLDESFEMALYNFRFFHLPCQLWPQQGSPYRRSVLDRYPSGSFPHLVKRKSWGRDQTADGQVYASEVSPLALQPYMTSATSLAWSVGGFISVAVLRGVINVENWGSVMSPCHHS